MLPRANCPATCVAMAVRLELQKKLPRVTKALLFTVDDLFSTVLLGIVTYMQNGPTSRLPTFDSIPL